MATFAHQGNFADSTRSQTSSQTTPVSAVTSTVFCQTEGVDMGHALRLQNGKNTTDSYVVLASAQSIRGLPVDLGEMRRPRLEGRSPRLSSSPRVRVSLYLWANHPLWSLDPSSLILHSLNHSCGHHWGQKGDGSTRYALGWPSRCRVTSDHEPEEIFNWHLWC
jgi:hypothetical protein